MNEPADIICFAKDWNEPKTSVNHVMEELSKRHRVLWVNSIAMRSPNLASGNDLKKIVRKLRSWFDSTKVIHPNLRVVTPIALPLPRSAIVQKINRCLVRWIIRRNARRWGFRKPQVWIFPPNAVEFLGLFQESLVVYYCVDDFAKMSYLNANFMVQKEAELLARADIVFVSAEKLLPRLSVNRKNVYFSPHGVDQVMFARALDSDFTPAADLKELPRPIIGFYGNLYDWVDQPLLAAMAQLRPQWSFVLIGKIMTDVSLLRACPNIHLLGPKPHEELPHYCKGFDIGIIPYKATDPRMESVNPLKLREYLAAGLPIVSIELPEVRRLGSFVKTASDAPGFVQAMEQLLREDSPALRRARSEAMKTESWTARVEEIESRIVALKN